MFVSAKKRGGKRAGAGRKPNFVGNIDASELLEAVHSEVAPAALKVLFDLAMTGDLPSICRIYRLFWGKSQAILSSRGRLGSAKDKATLQAPPLDLFGGPSNAPHRGARNDG